MSTIPDATGPDDASSVAPGDLEVDPPTDEAAPGETPHAGRQRVVKVGGARRARLLPAPGTSGEPTPADDRTRQRPAAPVASTGPNDDRLRRDVPPHY